VDLELGIPVGLQGLCSQGVSLSPYDSVVEHLESPPSLQLRYLCRTHRSHPNPFLNRSPA